MNQKDSIFSPKPEETAEEEEQRLLDELKQELAEADDADCVWIPHEVVEEQMRKELAELDALIAAGIEYATHLESQSDDLPPESNPLHRKK